MEEAVEIAKLRLFLALVAAAKTVDDLEPLPNIDFNILAGNSLIGLLRVDDKEFRASARQAQPLPQELPPDPGREEPRWSSSYRHATSYAEDLRALRDEIDDAQERG